MAADGKTLRGGLKQGGSIAHLLSAVCHGPGITFAQCSVDVKKGDKTSEIGVMPEMPQNLVLEGKIITADAMHTQRKTSQAIIDGNGDYALIVKGNELTDPSHICCASHTIKQ